MSCLIDTDNLISILRREKKPFEKSLTYLDEHERFNISCITYYECLRGYKSIGATKKYELFKEMLKFTDILYLDQINLEKASEIYSFLKPKGLLKGEFDLLIGATALVNDLVLVTNNYEHYKPLSEHFGLKIDNWM